MKKILCFLLTAAIAATASIGAFAATATGAEDKLPQKISSLQANQQKLESRLSAIKSQEEKLAAKKQSGAFQQDLDEKRLTQLDNREAIVGVLEQNAGLRLTIDQSRETLKQDGKKLTQDEKAQIKSCREQIRESYSSIKQLKGQMETLEQQNKANIKAKDTAATDSVFQQIYVLQNSRKDQLTKINGLLQKIASVFGTTAPTGGNSAV